MRNDERFKTTPEIVAQGTQQYSEAAAAEEAIANLSVDIPVRPSPGLAYRLTIAGTRSTGTNGSLAVKVKLGSTTVLTLTSDSNASADWMCTAVVILTSVNAQKCFGKLDVHSADAAIDYAAGTVDCSAGATMTASITQGHADDTSTVEAWFVEKWEMELSTS